MKGQNLINILNEVIFPSMYSISDLVIKGTKCGLQYYLTIAIMFHFLVYLLSHSIVCTGLFHS